MSPGGRWLVDQRTGSAAQLHRPWPPEEARSLRIVCRCRVTGAPALVLGSSQRPDDVDVDAVEGAGIELVWRRSGGGAVMVEPGGQLWLDAWIPRRDPLWQDDVVRSAFWFGEAWAGALRALGVRELSVHRQRQRTTAWSPLVCFAGFGPGEVAAGGRKVVGLSQRRTGAGASLHSVASLQWDPVAVLGLLALPPDERRRASVEIATAAVGLTQLVPGRHHGPGVLDTVAQAVLEHLPGR